MLVEGIRDLQGKAGGRCVLRCLGAFILLLRFYVSADEAMQANNMISMISAGGLFVLLHNICHVHVVNAYKSGQKYGYSCFHS